MTANAVLSSTGSRDECDLASILAALSAQEDGDRLSEEVCLALGTSSIVDILNERNVGGPGTLRDVLGVCRRVGRADASAAWVVGVANSAWSMRANFDAFEDADGLIGRNKIVAMVLGRPGLLTADPAAGGWRLEGSWAYASGAPYASYFFCLAAVADSDSTEVRVVAAPAAAFRVAAPWGATGLRRTQSVTLAADSILVNEANTVSYDQILSVGAGNVGGKPGGASYGHLFTGVLMNCLQGAILGAAEEALDIVAQMALERPVSGSTYGVMAASGAIRAEIGRLRGTLDVLLRAAEHNADRVDLAARSSRDALTVEDRVGLRNRATQVMRGAQRVVDDLLWIAGASALERDGKLERIWRDVNVGARHGGFSRLVAEELAGQVIVGRDPSEISQLF